MNTDDVKRSNEVSNTDEKSTAAGTTFSRPNHVCEIEVTFPTDRQAEQALQILQVDKEPTDRVSKSFELVTNETSVDKGNEGKDTIHILKVRFESKELKMVRVAVSSFYDYLNVVFKTFQEFDKTT